MSASRAIHVHTSVDQELEHRPLGDAGHAAGGPDAGAFHESSDDLGALDGAQLVHEYIMLERACTVKIIVLGFVYGGLAGPPKEH